MRLRLTSFFSLSALFLSTFMLPEANAAQKITYTLTVPFQYSYDQQGTFKPPVKMTQSNANFALTDNCNAVVGKKPKVEVRVASGKTVTSVNMRPAHRFSSANWIKDEFGENKFKVQGTCTFIADFLKRLPDSNYYQFSVYAEGSWQSSWSYPYTLKQLNSMKGGIKELRFIDDLRTPGVFSPIPDIEVPQIKPLLCTEGLLLNSGATSESGQGESVQVTYFMVTNAIYQSVLKSTNNPVVEHVGERIQSHKDYFVEVEGLNSVELINENTPAFVTWRRSSEQNFSTKLKISYSAWGPAETKKIASEKTFSVQISNDCKKVNITSP